MDLMTPRTLLLVVLTLFSMSVISEEKNVIPIDDFFQQSTDYQHVLSPNGKYLAYIKSYPNIYALNITDIDKKEVIYKTNISRLYPKKLIWLSDRRLMFNLKGKLYAINIDGEDIRVLADNIYQDEKKIRSYSALRKNYRNWKVANTLPDNDEEILVSSVNANGNMSIHNINVFTGEKIDLYDGDKFRIQSWLLDADGKVKLAIRRKRGKSSFFKFSEEKQKLISIDAKNKIKFNFSGKTFIGNRAIALNYSYKENEIYIIENNDSDKFSLSSYNFKTGEKNTILSDEKYDVGNMDDEPTLIFDHKNQRLAGIRYQKDKLTTVWFDERFKKIQAHLDKRYPDLVNVILQWKPKMDLVLFRSFNEKQYNKVVIYSKERHQMVVQTKGVPDITSERLASKEVIEYKTADGYSIEAYLTLPLNKSKNIPLIVMPHGGPFARSYPGYNSFIQYFASRGFAIIEPNYRGSTGYGRKHLLGAKGSIHDIMIEDIIDSAKWAIKEEIANPQRIHILGFSYGGYAAVMSAIKYPDFYHSAVSYGAPLDLKKQLNWYRENNFYFAYEYWMEMIFNQNKSRQKIKELSPFHQLDGITIPVAIFHGENDSVVPQEHAKSFKKALKKKKNTYGKITILNDEGHGINLKSNKIYFAEKALKLFSKE